MIHERIKLWKENEYAGTDGVTPALDTYILNVKENKGAVMVIPGGGYGNVSQREAEPVALWVNSLGFHAFVLYYSTAPAKHPQPLMDATRAMSIIRGNAGEWNIDSDKVAVCGFSAGGHLAASLGVYWNAPYLQNIGGMSTGMNRPNALILSYSVITGGEKSHRGSFDNLLGKDAPTDKIDEFSLEKHVKSGITPPAFIWTTFNDASVPAENSLMFAVAMQKEKIPYELHVFPDGVHGLSLCNKQTWEGQEHLINSHAGQWSALCAKWLKLCFDTNSKLKR